jgi:hypothetical protein
MLRRKKIGKKNGRNNDFSRYIFSSLFHNFESFPPKIRPHCKIKLLTKKKKKKKTKTKTKTFIICLFDSLDQVSIFIEKKKVML